MSCEAGMQQPEVSVIVPIYNRAKIFHRCLLSILCQQNICVELVLIDDCSTDESWHLVQQLCRENPQSRILVRRLDVNSAQATARNRGLELATAPYVAFIDSDDSFADMHILADMLSRMRADKLEMLVAPFLNQASDGTEAVLGGIDLPESAVRGRDCPAVLNMRSHWQALYARSFLDRVPLRFAEAIRHREDRPFVIAALLSVERLGSFERPMVHYHSDMDDGVMCNPSLVEFGYYLRHLVEVNNSLDHARAQGRLDPVFAQMNGILYAHAHLHYWRPAWNEMMTSQDPRHVALARSFDDQLARMFAPLQDFWPLADIMADHGIVQQAGIDLATARLDLLRVALSRRDRSLMRELLSPEGASLASLFALLPIARETALQALSFAAPGHMLRPRPLSGTTFGIGDLVERVILHVGSTKTGSSALQNWLEANRDHLLSQGMHYPVTGTWREDGARRHRNPGHAALFRELETPAGAGSLVQAMAEELAALPQRPHTLILSAETLTGPDFWGKGRGFARICAALGGRIEVHWVSRDKNAWMTSLWREKSCNPRIKFDQSLEDMTETFAEEGLFDVPGVQEVLGTPPWVTAVHVASYESLRESSGTIPWFAACAGIDTAGFADIGPAQANLSFDADQTVAIQALKAVPNLSPDLIDAAFARICAGDRTAVAQILAGLTRDPSRPIRIGGRSDRMAQSSLHSWHLAPSEGLRVLPLASGNHILRLPEDRVWTGLWLVEGNSAEKMPGPEDRLAIISWGGASLSLVDQARLAALGSQGRQHRLQAQSADGSSRIFKLCIERDVPAVMWLMRLSNRTQQSNPVIMRRLAGEAPLAAAEDMTEILVHMPGYGKFSTPQVRAILARSDRHFALEANVNAERNEVSDPRIQPVPRDAIPPQASDFFDHDAYAASVPGLAEAQIAPLDHYERYGWREGRSPQWGVPGGLIAGEAALPFMLREGLRFLVGSDMLPPLPKPAARPLSVAERVAREIDLAYYQSETGKRFKSPEDAAWHYLNKGWRDGADPHQAFSGKSYLAENQDVAAAGVAPFAHYVMHGRDEGRRVRPRSSAPEPLEAMAGNLPLWLENSREAVAGFDPQLSGVLPLRLGRYAAPDGIIAGIAGLRSSIGGRTSRLLVLAEGGDAATVAQTPDVLVVAESGHPGLPPDVLVLRDLISRETPPELLPLIILDLARGVGAKAVLGTSSPLFWACLHALGRQMAAEFHLAAHVAGVVPVSSLTSLHHLARLYVDSLNSGDISNFWHRQGATEQPPLRTAPLGAAVQQMLNEVAQ